jgi:hypothetical protein
MAQQVTMEERYSSKDGVREIHYKIGASIDRHVGSIRPLRQRDALVILGISEKVQKNSSAEAIRRCVGNRVSDAHPRAEYWMPITEEVFSDFVGIGTLLFRRRRDMSIIPPVCARRAKRQRSDERDRGSQRTESLHRCARFLNPTCRPVSVGGHNHQPRHPFEASRAFSRALRKLAFLQWLQRVSALAPVTTPHRL